jgi:RNA-binding protein 5/10
MDEKPAAHKGSKSALPKLKSTAPTNSTSGLGAKPGSLRRIFLMRDRRTDESWRFGFAEFASVDDAKAAVAKFKASPKFTISSKPVVIGFIHTGVFVPSLDSERPQHGDDREFSFSPPNNPAVRLQYWDERGYPSVLIVSKEPDSVTTQEASGNADSSNPAMKNTGFRSFTTKKPKKEKETGVKAIVMAPQMQMWAKKAAELHGVKEMLSSDRKTQDEKGTRPLRILSDNESHTPQGMKTGSALDEPRFPLPTDKYLSYADWDKLVCLVCEREAPTNDFFESRNMGHYSRTQWLIDHEVHAHNQYSDEGDKDFALQKIAALGKLPKTIVRRTPRLQSQPPPRYRSYADRDALICHLCSRQFKHAKTLMLHEQESELHKRMLSDAKNAERATEELKAKGKECVLMVPKTDKEPLYRDRAQERRAAFNQPTKPKAAGNSRKEPEPQAEEPVKKSKGAGMLAKMGWTSGAGLGAEGTGRTEAIASEAYAPGVGLGAEGGKLGDALEEAQRNTRGKFSDFVEKTRDQARERYERL